MGICLVFLDVSDEEHVFQKVGDTHSGVSGYGNAHNVAAPFFGNQLVLGQLGHNRVGICGGLIHLVDGYDDINACSLRVVDCFHGLGHDTVIPCYNEDRDVSALCAACSHCGERFVTGGIQEGDVTTVDLNTVRTDVLGNTAGFTAGNIGMADCVQNGGLTVVNVTHNADDGRTDFQVFLGIGFFAEQLIFNGNGNFAGYFGAKFVSNQVRGIEVDDLVDGSHHAHEHQLLDAFRSGDLQSLSQLTDGDFIGNSDLEGLLLRLFQICLLHLIHCEAFLVGLSAGTAVIASLVLLLQLLLVGLLVVDFGREIIQTFIVLGQVNGGGSGVYHAGLTGTLAFHALLDLGLGLGSDGSAVISGILVTGHGVTLGSLLIVLTEGTGLTLLTVLGTVLVISVVVIGSVAGVGSVAGRSVTGVSVTVRSVGSLIACTCGTAVITLGLTVSGAVLLIIGILVPIGTVTLGILRALRSIGGLFLFCCFCLCASFCFCFQTGVLLGFDSFFFRFSAGFFFGTDSCFFLSLLTGFFCADSCLFLSLFTGFFFGADSCFFLSLSAGFFFCADSCFFLSLLTGFFFRTASCFFFRFLTGFLFRTALGFFFRLTLCFRFGFDAIGFCFFGCFTL